MEDTVDAGVVDLVLRGDRRRHARDLAVPGCERTGNRQGNAAVRLLHITGQAGDKGQDKDRAQGETGCQERMPVEYREVGRSFHFHRHFKGLGRVNSGWIVRSIIAQNRLARIANFYKGRAAPGNAHLARASLSTALKAPSLNTVFVFGDREVSRSTAEGGKG